MPDLEDAGIFGAAYDDDVEGAEADFNNLELTQVVSPIPTTRIEPKKVTQALDDESWMDVKSAFLYGTIKEELYVSQPPGFVDLKFPDRVYKVEKALYGLHQAPRAWYETLSTYLLENGFRRGTIDKTLFIKKIKNDILVQVYVDVIIFGFTKESLSTEFEQLMHKRFQISSMRELTFFLRLVKSASTPMETHKPLSKDANGTNVDVHLYWSMFRSLMYLTSSRLDIMFVVCACSRFQVQPKVSHTHAVKRIFGYLKGQPTLGLWYPKDLPLELIAYSDSDYAGASLYRNPQQEVVSSKETNIHVDNESVICVVKNPVYHSKTKHIKIRHYFIRDSYEKRLIEMVKIHTDNNVADLLTNAFDVTWFQFLIASIVSPIQQMVINSPCLTDKKELAIPGQTATDADGIRSLPNTKIFDQLTLMGYVSNNDKLTFQKGVHIPLFATMLVHDHPGQGEGSPNPEQGSGNIAKTQTKATPSEPSSPRTSSEGGPGCHFTMGDSPVQARPKSVSNLPNEPPLGEGNTSRSGEGSMELLELMETCTKLSNRVTYLENELTITKVVYNKDLITFTKRVKKSENQLKHKRRSAIIHLSDEEEPSLGVEDSPKHGRMIEEINKDKDVNLVSGKEKVHEMDDSLKDDDDDDKNLATILLNIQKSVGKVKGKCIMQETEFLKKIKKKEMIQLSLDEELAQRLYAEELAKETARQEQEKIIL
uniref:Reverse transcriptase Ty1/copia-type domain-containing protein n=1 Tax=Tanacetum cinerariifolium TaxID=118510 RepID=A0A699GIF8_TANCI|nr:hypothetical protein [Tanacetum cinerariifolium]